MIRTENISESEEQRMNKKIFKRAVAMMMAAVLTVGAALPSSNVFASGSDEEKDIKTLAVYDADVRTDLDEDEVVTAGDIVIAAGYGFDIENDMEGIVYEQEKVTVSYYPDQGSFDADKQGDYDTYYKVEPVSGKDAYLVHRTIAVKEITTEQTDNTEAAPTEDTTETADDEEPAPGSEDTEYIDLDTQIVKGLSIQRAPAAMLKAAPATGTKDGKDSMKVGFSGYAKFCGRSMGVKYISESGDYYHHSVYCLDLNKKTTNGTVSKSSSTKKVKPEITYCLVNGVRELNKTCHNSKYSSGHATEDYFITGAAIHVLNGEVKLSYYGKGNTGTYAKISALVTDAKKYSTDDYNDNGLTKSISYSISPAKSKWEKVADGLYRSKEKFVRTKKGTIKNIKYTISGAPAGLTTGEIKTNASKIDDENDLKKYDICVAQTDASKASSNFYLYCNQTAMDKITKNDSTIKVRAKAYSDEKGGSKWTPTVVSQQKITFLEEFIDQKSDEATVKVTSNYKLGSFQLHKTDSYKGTPVAGAKYYLYEDSACTDLLCKLNVTNSDGLAASGVEVLTESKYYLKEVKAPDGYQVDENVYEIGLEYFTQYDESGKVTKAGKAFEAKETPETVGVLVQKTDSESGNVVKGAGFAVFKDASCTQRVLMNGDTGAEVPVFYYDEDLDGAASEKFVKQQDAVIGNVPFGDFKLYDRKHNAMEFKVHDHFIAKSIDHVRPGGIVAVITTKGTLDKQNSTVRKYLAQRAELIGAIRLPNTAFKADAGTEVTSDILFFQKRERKIVAEPDWVHLGLTEDKIPVNSYFVEHPEMILGYMIRDTGRFGENSNLTACVNDDPDFDLQEALSRAVSNIHAQITDFERTVEEGEAPEEYLPADPDVKNFTYTFIDGVLYFRKDSRMVRQEVGDKVLERIKGMDAIRTATRHLIDIQLSGCSEQALRQAQEELNTVYDQFTKKYGYITAKGNARAFRDDGDYPLLCSLEMVDEDGVVSKADIRSLKRFLFHRSARRR